MNLEDLAFISPLLHFPFYACLLEFLSYQLAALLAATSWALSSLIAAEPSRRLGGARFCRIRMLYVSVMLIIAATISGGLGTLNFSDTALVAVSGLIGIFVGDVALFTAMARIGPRRTGMLFTLNAPMTAIGGALFFEERLTVSSFTGSALILLGITLAIVFGNPSGETGVFERIQGSLFVGIFWAAIGALGQAGGALAAKPILDDGADTLAVAALRALIATVAMWLVPKQTDKLTRSVAKTPLLKHDQLKLATSALIAMVCGMTLLLYALGNGDAGIVSILSATTPVLLLPLQAVVTKKMPIPFAWFGAILAVLGTSFLI
ncbi:MAG: DMT family transporter [Acidimicrobiales bacterium]|jgi:drug/metabolite transporter (DMT)-like permease|nr:DMT family transporter [Acidimicrobiales bacterium]